MWAILPIKGFVAGKSRLSGVLTPGQRARLIAAMAGDVFAVLKAEPRIAGVCVVSNDACVGAMAARWGGLWLTERELGARPDLNGAVEGASKRLASWPCEEMLVVHGDLPRLDGPTLARFIDAWRQLAGPGRLALAPSHDGGTSLLLRDPRDPLDFSYGPDSLALHARQGRRRGGTVCVAELERAALDVDTPDDLRRLVTAPLSGCGARTARQLTRFCAPSQTQESCGA